MQTGVDTNQRVRSESIDKIQLKAYHAPQLSEWGKLEEITLGGTDGDTDAALTGPRESNPLGKSPGHSSIPPWALP